VKTAKDLIIPFAWSERRPILLDRFFYVPPSYPWVVETIPFFSQEQPIFIEYCSGNGQWIGERAKQNPHINWLAVEKRFDRARMIWLKSHREKLENLVTVCSEGAVFTRYYAPKVKEIFINFPDPWPKLRHAKHRLIQAPFLQEVRNILQTDGRITCVTDDQKYAAQMVLEFEKCPSDWKLIFQGNEWPDYGRSFFNDLWLQKGRTIHYLAYEKI
jgi:tRNA (guanine-N7-)-methyltransferase